MAWSYPHLCHRGCRRRAFTKQWKGVHREFPRNGGVVRARHDKARICLYMLPQISVLKYIHICILYCIKSVLVGLVQDVVQRPCAKNDVPCATKSVQGRISKLPCVFVNVFCNRWYAFSSEIDVDHEHASFFRLWRRVNCRRTMKLCGRSGPWHTDSPS